MQIDSGSIVKLVCTLTEQSYSMPWSKRTISSGGSAIAIKPNVLLTCAHVVKGAIMIECYVHNQEFTGEVIKISEECDLALIKIEGKVPGKPIKIAESAYPGMSVVTAGYPIGSSQMRVARGSLNRIVKRRYTSRSNGLGFEIDSDINFGDSGGGSMANGELICISQSAGMVYDKKVDYGVPYFIIRRFIETEHIFNYIPFDWQPITNPNMKAKLGEGIIVLSEAPGLKPSTVIKKVNDIPIINGRLPLNQFIPFESEEPITFQYAISLLDQPTFHTDKPVKFKMPPHKTRYARPTYYQWGGLIFVPITEGLLAEHDFKRWSGYEGLVLAKIIGTKNNQGYNSLIGEVVDCVNGKEVNTIGEIEKQLNKKGPDVVITFQDESRFIVLDHKRALADTKKISKIINH
jgi:hypothetical protein